MLDAVGCGINCEHQHRWDCVAAPRILDTRLSADFAHLCVAARFTLLTNDTSQIPARKHNATACAICRRDSEITEIEAQTLTQTA